MLYLNHSLIKERVLMMEKYKIKVNNEAESKEAQELFEKLGYRFSCMHYSDEDNSLQVFDGGSGSLFEDHDSCSHQELTISQLRDLVAQEQGLISGDDAKLAWAKGEIIEYSYVGDWCEIDAKTEIGIFDRKDIALRIKPRTIKLEIEIPACGTNYKHGQLIWILNSLEPNEYCSVILDESDELPAYWWAKEEEIKKVVAALRGGIKQ